MGDAENKQERLEPAGKLGACIRQARERKGLSIRALAAQVGLHPSYVFRLEGEQRRQPSPEKLQRIADALGIDHGDLYALAGYRAPQGLPDLMPYLRARYRMTDETAEELATYFDKLKRERRIVERTTPMTRKADDLGFGSPESVKWENL